MLEGVDVHVEETIFLVGIDASLQPEGVGPVLVVTVAPLAAVLLGAPRVPDLDESNAVAQRHDAWHGEGVALDEAT